MLGNSIGFTIYIAGPVRSLGLFIYLYICLIAHPDIFQACNFWTPIGSGCMVPWQHAFFKFVMLFQSFLLKAKSKSLRRLTTTNPASPACLQFGKSCLPKRKVRDIANHWVCALPTQIRSTFLFSNMLCRITPVWGLRLWFCETLDGMSPLVLKATGIIRCIRIQSIPSPW